jgi:hypothetical protein
MAARLAPPRQPEPNRSEYVISRLRAEATIEPGNLEFLIKSPPLTILTNHRLYTVSLSLYSDNSHTQLLGVHEQQVLFSIPPDMEMRVEKEYGVRVQ